MKNFRSHLLAALCAVTASCSSSLFTDYPDDAWFGLDAFDHGEFQASAEEFQRLNGTLEGNEFLAHAEAGMALHVGGDLEGATQAWLRAVETLDGYGDRPTISGRSLGEGAASLLLNDKTMPYDGEGFEAVLLHGFLAWDYLRLGLLDDALVEAKRGYEFEAFEEERFGTSYGMNRFARFVAALSQEIAGQYQDARIDLERLLEEVPGHESVNYSMARVRDLIARDPEALQQSTLVVVYERGRMPCKTSFELDYSTHRSIGRISVPGFGRAAWSPSHLSVQVGDRVVGSTETLEDIEAVAGRNLEDRITWTLAKSIGRSAMKTILVDKAAEKAEEDHGEWAGVLVGLSGSLLNMWSEQADLRSWLTLPRQIQVLRVPIDSGRRRILLHGDGSTGGFDLGIHSFEPGRPVLIGVRAIGNRLYTTPASTTGGTSEHEQP